MNYSKIIPLTLIIVLFCVLLIYSLSTYGYISSVFTYSAYVAIFVTSVNYCLGMLSIKIGINKSHKTFLISAFGGMLIRLILLILLVFIALKFLDISRNIFIFLVLFFYILYLVSEVSYLIFRDKEIKKL